MPNLKHLATNSRVRNIFQKHLSALTRDLVALSQMQTQELTEELTTAMLANWGLTNEDLQLQSVGPVVELHALVPSALIYDTETRRWTCPRCHVFSDHRRRSVTAHLRFCKAEPPVASIPLRNVPRKKPRPVKKTT
jgi:hypothetical protein